MSPNKPARGTSNCNVAHFIYFQYVQVGYESVRVMEIIPSTSKHDKTRVNGASNIPIIEGTLES